MKHARLLVASGLVSLSLVRGLAQGAMCSVAPVANWSVALAAFSLAEPEAMTKENVIAGTMDIDFATRTNKDTSGELKANSPAKGAKDQYKFNLLVADTTRYSGVVTRQPNLFSKTLGRRQQDAELFYSIDLAVRNPKDLKQERTVGKWVGTVPIDSATGAYDLAGGKSKESALRISVDAVGKAAAFQDEFRGRLVGKAENKESLATYTYKRIVGTRTVQVVVKKSDPMRFESMKMAKGPADSYPPTTVSGRLDYDYETGNWYTDGLRMTYELDGKEYEDVLTGSIKWVEDADRSNNGKGYYDFNLRFNEEKNRKAGGEAAAFDGMADEDAFFAVDDTMPALTGRVSYIDTMNGETVTSSKVTYNLHANKLSKQQVVNFFKMWMVGIGPINDE